MGKIIVSTEKTKSTEKKSLITRIKLWFKQVKHWFKRLKKPWKIGLLVLLIVIIVVVMFFVIKAVASPTPDDQLRKIADMYYEEKIEPADKKSTSYTLVLKNLQKLGYDTSPFESAGCSLDSYVVIYLNTSEGTYTTDTKLVDCE